jgi:glycerol-3-phosphate dehydrogenase
MPVCREIKARYVINAAGLFADDVSRIFSAEEFTITARKGEYYLLDRLTKACPSRVVFPVPTAVSKGMLVIPTAEGTALVGPTADDTSDKNDYSTSSKHLEQILVNGKKMIPFISHNDVITSFAGIRPCLEFPPNQKRGGDENQRESLNGDFYIEASKKAPCFVQVAGIQSPGLTASPAIAEYVKKILTDMGLQLTEKPHWNTAAENHPCARNLGINELDSLIKKEPSWGNIVCRCESVSEAEIIQAVRLGHTTLDGVKYFTRAQMGRCQGGFCACKIIKIIMKEANLSYNEVTKHGRQSFVLSGELRQSGESPALL